MVKNHKSAEQCAADLDAALDNLVFECNGTFIPRTCFCCDCILLNVDENPSVFGIKRLTKCVDLFHLDDKLIYMSDHSTVTIPDDVIEYYKYDVQGRFAWLRECVLSPNSCYCERRKGFITCKKCFTSLKKNKYPQMGIKNGLMIGTAPSLVNLLSDEEMSCISLVRNTAHIFTYMGGQETTIKGWHSMVEVDVSQVHRTLRGMDHTELGFPDSITIVLEGPMTFAQYAKLKRRANASRKNMLKVLTWYIENNYLYAAHFKLMPSIESIPTPHVIEKVQIVDSIDANIELTEEMSMVFPDETLDETTGGFQSTDKFKEVISEINKGNTTATLTSRASTYVYANCDDNFVKAFPRQYPYGIGGPNQMRLSSDDELRKIDFTTYVQHVNNLSNRNFHTQQFSILTWNMLEKREMVNRACLRIKPDTVLQQKISEAQTNEMQSYISAILNGHVPPTTHTCEGALLDAVNSITYTLPHSNADAYANRKKAFSMQLRFGFPFVFFTVAPDDSSSYTVSVYVGLKFNPNDRLEELTEEDFVARATLRQELRIKFAGMGALWYNAVMNAIWKNVLGWNWRTNQASPGLYGIPEAAMEATEEQTRKRLHSHCLIWIKNASQLLLDLQSSNVDKVLRAKNDIIDVLDRSTSTKLIDKQALPNRIFQHQEPCTTISKQTRTKPHCVSPQQLRNMRHRTGKNEHKGVIAKCSTCGQNYTVEELVVMSLNYWNSVIDSHEFEVDTWSLLRQDTEDNDHLLKVTGKKKMEELLFILSTPRSARYPELCEIITNAVRNLHSDRHVIQCFKKGDECRYHLPTLHVVQTIIDAMEQFDDWYDYLGNKSLYFLYDVNIKRSEYDVFQNQACRAISLSKLGSNSNSQLCISGQKAMYITKYPTKSTQKEDESEYENILHYTSLRLGDRRFEHDCSEALSRAIGASLAHSSSNIISAWLAKHLIHQRSRFRFSHEFRNIPHFSIQDELFNGNSRWRQLKSCCGKYYIDSSALQYLHRPASLESLCLTDFVLHYHVARKTEANKKRMINYKPDGTYDAAEYQGILRSQNKREYIPDINVWGFPDASDFDGLLLEANTEITGDMEEYALEVLICFCPFRKLDDLLVNFSYVLKFRQWYADLQMNSKQYSYIHRVLTNIQNLKNSLRIKSKDDILCDHTRPFVDPNEPSRKKQRSQKCDKQQPCYDENTLEFIISIVQQHKVHAETATFTHKTALSLFELQNKGTWKCGFCNIASMDKQNSCFPIYSDNNPITSSSTSTSNKREVPPIFQKLTKSALVQVMLQRTIRQHSTQQMSSVDNHNNDEGSSPNKIQHGDIDANGTPESIHLWALQAFGNDREQQRAFEILASKFVLSYCAEADDTDDTDDTLFGTNRHQYLRCKKLLRQMIGQPAKIGQLIMFITGPGGSGKSEIINQLLVYGQQFCSNIEQPFTRHTILVTACSGVAATLIHGQTLHSATFLNKEIRNIDIDDKARFQNGVKLLIVDEISMLSGSDLKSLSKRLNWLMDNYSGVYGGLDISFMGDFRQLPPIGKKPIYETKTPEFRSFVNCYISLNGQYRFKDDPSFGDICRRFHNGCPTVADFITINNRVVSPLNMLPKNVRTACKRNDEREAINVGTWLQYLNDHGEDQGFVILADNVQVRKEGSSNKYLHDLTTFYTKVGEDNCDTHMEGRFTPMLRCYPRCPQMLTTNIDVGNNLANGTQGFCTGVVLEPGKNFHTRQIDNMTIKCVYASQIKYVLWEVDGTTIHIKPKQYCSLKADFPLPNILQHGTNQRATLYLKATQVPLISNNATTGHKLQGASVEHLYIPSWNYSTNWPYVALSRVRTLNGLYLGRSLHPFKDYSVPEKLTRMLNTFATRVVPQTFDYEELDITT